jgi:hypothetical protein
MGTTCSKFYIKLRDLCIGKKKRRNSDSDEYDIISKPDIIDEYDITISIGESKNLIYNDEIPAQEQSQNLCEQVTSNLYDSFSADNKMNEIEQLMKQN